MTEQKTTDDIIIELQKIINPLMLLTAHYDVLSMFVESCKYDGAIIDQKIDTLEDYYQLYNEAPEKQQKQIIDDLIQQDINPIFLSDFFITYEQDLEVMKQQDSNENKQYMESLNEEIYNPTGLIKEVKAYANGL